MFVLCVCVCARLCVNVSVCLCLCVLSCVGDFDGVVALLYESPGGNQVDGLPPALNIGLVGMGRPRPAAKMCDIDPRTYRFNNISQW